MTWTTLQSWHVTWAIILLVLLEIKVTKGLKTIYYNDCTGERENYIVSLTQEYRLTINSTEREDKEQICLLYFTPTDNSKAVCLRRKYRPKLSYNYVNLIIRLGELKKSSHYKDKGYFDFYDKDALVEICNFGHIRFRLEKFFDQLTVTRFPDFPDFTDFYVVDSRSSKRISYLDGDYCLENPRLIFLHQSWVTVYDMLNISNADAPIRPCGVRIVTDTSVNTKRPICVVYAPAEDYRECAAGDNWKLMITRDNSSNVEFQMSCMESNISEVHTWCGDKSTHVYYLTMDNSSPAAETRYKFKLFVTDYQNDTEEALKLDERIQVDDLEIATTVLKTTNQVLRTPQTTTDVQETTTESDSVSESATEKEEREHTESKAYASHSMHSIMLPLVVLILHCL